MTLKEKNDLLDCKAYEASQTTRQTTVTMLIASIVKKKLTVRNINPQCITQRKSLIVCRDCICFSNMLKCAIQRWEPSPQIKRATYLIGKIIKVYNQCRGISDEMIEYPLLRNLFRKWLQRTLWKIANLHYSDPDLDLLKFPQSLQNLITLLTATGPCTKFRTVLSTKINLIFNLFFKFRFQIYLSTFINFCNTYYSHEERRIGLPKMKNFLYYEVLFLFLIF